MTLPRVLMTDVIRSSQQGDSHGGVRLIDLETGEHELLLDWDKADIDWSGRGMDRGLRGICFVGDEIYIAAADELFVFDQSMTMLRSHRCPFLGHCHEISYDGERFVYLSSTRYNSVLRFDVRTGAFDRAWWFGVGKNGVVVRGFDPMGRDGPPDGDVIHLNQVVVFDGRVYVSALRGDVLWELGETGASVYARTAVSTHNAQPLGDGLVVMNATGDDCVVIGDRTGKVMKRLAYPVYEESALGHAGIDGDHARQGFGRGLCVDEGQIIAGSSPGTVSAFDRVSGEVVSSVNVSMDIRNSPHGLEIWPY